MIKLLEFSPPYVWTIFTVIRIAGPNFDAFTQNKICCQEPVSSSISSTPCDSSSPPSVIKHFNTILYIKINAITLADVC